MRQKQLISDLEWNYFLRGATGIDVKRPSKPEIEWMPDEV